MIERLTHSAEETMGLAAGLAQGFRGGEFIALCGDLGAGKTCFVRGLARGLRLDARAVSSPTFVIMHEYESAAPDGRPALIHIDAYRLGGAAELEGIGWEEVLERRDAVIALEWPQRVGEALPADRIDVSLEHRGGEERLIRIEARGRATIGGALRAGIKAARRPCPVCRLEVDADSETFPFCSQRCRLADLHRWMGGAYRVSRAADDPRDWEEAPE